MCLCFLFSKDDAALIRKNRTVLLQRLTHVLPILDSLLAAGVISEHERGVLEQKARTPLQAGELLDTVLGRGSSAATVFKNSLQEMDPVLYKRIFGECCSMTPGNFLG